MYLKQEAIMNGNVLISARATFETTKKSMPTWIDLILAGNKEY